MFREWLTRLRFVFFRKRRADLDEELEFHLDQAIQSAIARGISPEEARRQANIEFGSGEATREQTLAERPTHRLETAFTDFHYAVRGCLRNPAFALSVLLTFTLGIGATTAVFNVVDRILFRPLPYAQPDRLVSVGLVAPIVPTEFMLGGSYYTWRDEQKPFESFTSETGVDPCDLTEESPARLNCAHVEANFLSTLGVGLPLGRNFTRQEDAPKAPRVAIISDRLWHERFNRDPGVIQRVLNLDGQPTRIVGVLPASFEFPTLDTADVLVPQALDEAAQRKADPGRVMFAFARLRTGISIEDAKKQLQPVFNYSLSLAPPPSRKEVHLLVRTLRDRQVHDVRLVAWVLFGVVITMLLIACANVVSLLMARSASREREFAVRAALGASRARLIQQALIEALTLAFAGAIAGFAFAYVLLRTFIAIAPDGMPFLTKATLDLRIFAFTLTVSLLCGVACGLFAALLKPRAEALAGRTSMSAPHARLRQSLVVLQIAASLVLLSGGALLVRSFWNLERQRLGITTEHIVTATISLGQLRYPDPQEQMAFFNQLERSLKFGPGVSMLAVSDTVPPGGYHHDQIYAPITINGVRQTGGTGGLVAWRWVSPDYFRILGIPMLKGSGFTGDQLNSPNHFLVLSQSLAARMFPDKDPMGQHVQLAAGAPDDPVYTVAGVAGDVKNDGLTGNDMPEYYRLRRNQPDDWGRDATFIVKTNLPLDTVARFVREQSAAIDPTVPVEIQSLSQRVRNLADRPLFESSLVGLFAATGLLMTIIGLYGVISFLVARRTQEIGLRMAMGATRADILRLILSSGLRLIVPGALLGLVAALALSRLLESVLFHIAPRDPLTFAFVTLVLMTVAVFAALIPAGASARLNPMDALRCE